MALDSQENHLTMTTESTVFEIMIRPLVERYLSDNHNVDGVGFFDQFFDRIGKLDQYFLSLDRVRCTPAGNDALRFELAGQAALEVKLDRAKSKLRLLCARLAVLCSEPADREVSIYGGEGIIERGKPDPQQDSDDDFDRAGVELTREVDDGILIHCQRKIDPPYKRWRIRFKNTPSEQEFTISKCSE